MEHILVQFLAFLTDTTADLLLYGVMQDLVSEAAGSPFLKTFEWDGSTTGVSGAAPNKFYTLNGYNPDTSENWQLKSCVLSSLSISADPGSNGGRGYILCYILDGISSYYR